MTVLRSSEIALVVNQDALRVPARMRSLRKLAQRYKLKLRMCDGQDLDHTLRVVLRDRALKRLIIGGGDGTVGLAASLVNRLRPSVQIAIIPLGTANYYAMSLGLKKNIQRSFSIALGDNLEKRHVCRANSRDFLIGVNVGTTSRMFAEITDEDKRRFGRIAYFRGIARVLLKFQPPDLVITANGKTETVISTELVILNQAIKEPIHITPRVKGSEPYFEIITYGLGNGKLSPLFGVAMFALSLGKNQSYLKRIRATSARIASHTPQPVAIDGESIEQLPLEITLVKRPVIFVRS